MAQRLKLTFALAALGTLSQGCVDNEVSFFIEQIQVPQASGLTGCTVSADPAALHRNFGVLDLTVSSGYVLSPLYRSELLAYERRASGRPETRGLFVDGANIELHQGNETGPMIDAYQVVTTAFVEPASAQGPGYGVGDLELVPPSIGQQIAQQICQPNTSDVTDACPVPVWPDNSLQLIAVIKPFGHTMGGIQISGSHFVFPITFCCHCLVQFPAAASDPNTMGPNCSSTTATTTTACTPGQDDLLDCRQCSAGNVQACQPRGFRAGTASCPY